MGRHLYSLLLLLCTPLLIAHVVRKYRREHHDPMVGLRLGAHVPDQMDGHPSDQVRAPRVEDPPSDRDVLDDTSSPHAQSEVVCKVARAVNTDVVP